MNSSYPPPGARRFRMKIVGFILMLVGILVGPIMTVLAMVSESAAMQNGSGDVDRWGRSIAFGLQFSIYGVFLFVPGAILVAIASWRKNQTRIARRTNSETAEGG